MMKYLQTVVNRYQLHFQDWDSVSEVTYADSLLFRHYASSSGKRRGNIMTPVISDLLYMIYMINYAHRLELYLAVVISFNEVIMDSFDLFTDILHGCVTGIEAILCLKQNRWGHLEVYG